MIPVLYIRSVNSTVQQCSLTIISSDKLSQLATRIYRLARASAVFGTLQEIEPDSEIIAAYLERTNVYVTANDFADEKKVAVLLTVIGPKIFTLLCSLTMPELPQDKSFEELEAVLKALFQPKPLVIAERFAGIKPWESPCGLRCSAALSLCRLRVRRIFE